MLVITSIIARLAPLHPRDTSALLVCVHELSCMLLFLHLRDCFFLEKKKKKKSAASLVLKGHDR